MLAQASTALASGARQINGCAHIPVLAMVQNTDGATFRSLFFFFFHLRAFRGTEPHVALTLQSILLLTST